MYFCSLEFFFFICQHLPVNSARSKGCIVFTIVGTYSCRNNGPIVL